MKVVIILIGKNVAKAQCTMSKFPYVHLLNFSGNYFYLCMVGVVLLLLLQPGDYIQFMALCLLLPSSMRNAKTQWDLSSFSTLVNAYCLTFIQFLVFDPALTLIVVFAAHLEPFTFCSIFFAKTTVFGGKFCQHFLILMTQSVWGFLTLLSQLPDILASLQISCRLCNFELTGN